MDILCLICHRRTSSNNVSYFSLWYQLKMGYDDYVSGKKIKFYSFEKINCNDCYSRKCIRCGESQLVFGYETFVPDAIFCWVCRNHNIDQMDFICPSCKE